MKRTSLLAAAALLASTLPAFAGAMDGVFGNTLRVTYADGSVVDHYMNEDGTFSTDTGVEGTWTLDELTLCITVDGNTNCGPIEEGRGIGAVWEEDDGQGGTRSVTIVEGR